MLEPSDVGDVLSAVCEDVYAELGDLSTGAARCAAVQCTSFLQFKADFGRLD